MIAILVIALLICVNISYVSSSQIPTVDAISVPAYLGFWYQMYANAASTETFEKDAYCSTALYGANEDGTISIVNDARIGSNNGTDYMIAGYAYYAQETEPGQLMVHLDTVPKDSTYWIFELGPINTDGLYDYALVTDSTGIFLYVLARNPTVFLEKYNEDVLVTVNSYGFTGLKKPIASYQNTDCIYQQH